MIGSFRVDVHAPDLEILASRPWCFFLTNENFRFCEPMQYANEYGIITIEKIENGPSIMIGIPPSDDPESSAPSNKRDDEDNPPL